MSLNPKLEFGRNWTCKLTPRSEWSECAFESCHNGECVVGSYESGYMGPISTQCYCDPGWIGQSCEFCCDLPCVEGRGRCMWDHDANIPFCACIYSALRYTGPLCEDEISSGSTQIPESNEDVVTGQGIAAIVSSVLVVVIVICIILALLRLLRQRPPWLQSYLIRYHTRNIDKVHNQYDVFVSYRTSDKDDRLFVTETLLPYLEEKQLSVCIDERDFIPGIAIKSNIEEAIQKSKRTILILSPAFIQGVWPEYEVQCALLESLRKNKIVIPIIYKPIDSAKGQVSESLNHILNSVLCIEWPKDESKTKLFWSFLDAALPSTTGGNNMSPVRDSTNV